MANDIRQLIEHLARRKRLGLSGGVQMSQIGNNRLAIKLTKVCDSSVSQSRSHAASFKRSASRNVGNGVFNSFEKRLMRQSRIETAQLIVNAARKFLAR
jgi:hypothetical protein